MVIEFKKEMKQVKTKVAKMFEDAIYNDQYVIVHFSVGKKEDAINTHVTCNPLDVEVNDNMIMVLPAGSQTNIGIDMSQFDCVKCDDECVDDLSDAAIDMISDYWSVRFDFLNK